MFKRVGVMLLSLGLWTAPAAATVPSQFTVQGVLRDNTGALQSMSVPITVKLFDASVGGTQLFQAGPTGVMAQNGLFTVVPSLTSTDLAAVAGAGQVWLELTAGSDTFPRQMVTSQLFALVAGGLQCSGCVDSSMLASTLSLGSDMPQTTPVVVINTNATGGGNLGRTGLQIRNSATVTSNTLYTQLEITDSKVSTQLGSVGASYTLVDGLAGYSVLGNNQSGVILYATDPGGNIKLVTGGVDGNANARMIVDPTGKVGIGTLTPQVALDVAGVVRLARNSSQPFVCDTAHDASLALTSKSTMCVCKDGSGWVSVTDGTTACVF